MAGTAFVDQLKAKFGAKDRRHNFENIDPWIEVTPDGLNRSLPLLPTSRNCLRLSQLHFGRRLFSRRREESGQGRVAGRHTEVVYHLFSMKHKHSLVLKVILPRWKDERLRLVDE